MSNSQSKPSAVSSEASAASGSESEATRSVAAAPAPTSEHIGPDVRVVEMNADRLKGLANLATRDPDPCERGRAQHVVRIDPGTASSPQARAVAHNGRCIAIVPVPSAAGLLGALHVPRDFALQVARDGRRCPPFRQNVALHINGTVSAHTKRGATMATAPEDCHYPDADSVVPEAHESDTCVTINATYLAQLQAALTGDDLDCITLRIPRGAFDSGKPIRVEGAHGYGALMPIDTKR